MIKSTPECSISSIPLQGPSEEILAQNRTKFHEMVDFLGGVIREEGRGFRTTCPACDRGTLHVSPTPDNRIGIRCHYCGSSAPRRVLKESGFDIPAPAPQPINHDLIDYWWRHWRNQGAKPIEGTLGDTYLRFRGIDIRSFARGTFRHLQFVPRASFGQFIAPAMVGWTYSTFGDDTYKPATVHVTYLRYDGLGKISVPDARRTFGPPSGAVIFFVPDDARATRMEREQYWWVVGEGIETVLSYMAIKRIQGERRVCGISALNGGGLQYLSLPKFVRRVIVAGDNDANGTGQNFSNVAYWRFAKEGRQARYALPEKTGQDWNDVLRDCLRPTGSGLEVAS